MNKNFMNVMIFLWASTLAAGCHSDPHTTQWLQAELGLQRRMIEMLEAESKRLIVKQADPSLLKKTAVQKPRRVSERDAARAFQIVREFTAQVDNVDSAEHGEFIGMIVRDIDPLDDKRNIELLDYICRQYTPTDYRHLGRACDKLRLYEMALVPSVNPDTKRGGTSPLLSLFD